MEPNASKSPDRIHRLYAVLQSTGKGASRFGKASKDFFNEHIKMNQEQTKKLYLASTELDLMKNNAPNHKDSLSRLSEAIELLKSKKFTESINNTEPPNIPLMLLECKEAEP